MRPNKLEDFNVVWDSLLQNDRSLCFDISQQMQFAATKHNTNDLALIELELCRQLDADEKIMNQYFSRIEKGIKREQLVK